MKHVGYRVSYFRHLFRDLGLLLGQLTDLCLQRVKLRLL